MSRENLAVILLVPRYLVFESPVGEHTFPSGTRHRRVKLGILEKPHRIPRHGIDISHGSKKSCFFMENHFGDSSNERSNHRDTAAQGFECREAESFGLTRKEKD